MTQQRPFGPGNAMPEPMPIDQMRKLLRYDRDTGELFWLVERGCNAKRIKPGDLAGTLKASGYVVVRIGLTGYYAHRIAWFIETGVWPGPTMEIDHLNDIKSDNRWCNLRIATKAQNLSDVSKKRSNATGFRGVYANGNRFVGCVSVNGKKLKFPTRETAEEAYADYCAAALRYHGQFARLS